MRGANFGIDPEDDERNVVQLRMGDVECLGVAWRSTTELRCQMQPIPVGETTLHVVAARSTAAPYEVLADCAPGSFQRLDEKLQQLIKLHTNCSYQRPWRRKLVWRRSF